MLVLTIMVNMNYNCVETKNLITNYFNKTNYLFHLPRFHSILSHTNIFKLKIELIKLIDALYYIFYLTIMYFVLFLFIDLW